MEQHTIFFRFGVALFIGVLAGLQREYAYDRDSAQPDHPRPMFAGIRTFALFGLGGCVAAYVADLLASPLVFVGIFIILGFD